MVNAHGVLALGIRRDFQLTRFSRPIAGIRSETKKNVGILALEVYTPRTFIRQSALEEHAGVAAGKYTLGLGQEGLAVTGDAEDVNSLCLTAVHSLLEK